MILQQDIDPMVHPLRIRQITPMPEQMPVLPQFTTPRRRMDLQGETQTSAAGVREAAETTRSSPSGPKIVGKV